VAQMKKKGNALQRHGSQAPQAMQGNNVQAASSYFQPCFMWQNNFIVWVFNLLDIHVHVGFLYSE